MTHSLNKLTVKQIVVGSLFSVVIIFSVVAWLCIGILGFIPFSICNYIQPYCNIHIQCMLEHIKECITFVTTKAIAIPNKVLDKANQFYYQQ